MARQPKKFYTVKETVDAAMSLKIFNVFLGSQARRGWPCPYYNVDVRAKEWIVCLEGLKSKLGFDVEFVGNEVIFSMSQVNDLERSIDEDVDAIFTYILTSESTRFTYLASRKIADFGYDYIHEYGGYEVPTIFVIDLYGGDISGLPLVKYLREKNRKSLVISSSSLNEVAKALRYVYVIKMLRKSKAVVITRREANPAKYVSPHYLSRIQEKLGVVINYVDYEDVKNLYDKADEVHAKQIAEEIIKNAKEVREPPKEDIIKAAKIYLALRELIEREGANAIAIDCLGWLEYGKILMPTTPCLALSLLNSEGVVSACEADLHSMLTMLIFRYLDDKPSFISDPVVDMHTNSVIHCHCTAPLAMDKVGGKREQYILRTHADSGTGVGVQVLMEKGRKVTVAKFVKGLDKMVAARGEIVENVDIDRGCRTKVKVTIVDANKYLYEYSGGLHRVLAYGDHIDDLVKLGKLLGFDVELEGE